ncbi:MAG: priA [Bacillota bacterium]|nr:priA [Bacillota bacterium]
MFNIYVQVILNNNSKSTDRVYTYGVDPCFESKVSIGKRVKVKFGHNKHILDALIVSLSKNSNLDDSKIKSILDVIDEKPIIKEEMVKLCFWIRERYLCKFSDAIRLMVPSGIKYEHNIIINVISSGFSEISLNEKEGDLLNILKNGSIELNSLKKLYVGQDLYPLIQSLKEKNIIEIINEEKFKKNFSQEKIIFLKDEHKSLNDYDIKKTEAQINIINYLKENGKTNIKNVINNLNVSSSVINNLIKKEIIVCEMVLYEKNENQEDHILNEIKNEKNINLNQEQKNAVHEIIYNKNNVFLLHGITGSGKTEVYMEIIEYYQKRNKQSIMLVPEISLTAQTIERFKKRFGNKIAVFHSRLSKKEKFIEWNKVYKKEVDVIIGARSAIFLPISNLGAIIIDEEHEDSYKSSTAPKYDTVEVAIRMSVLLGAKIILGTATPSLNTYNMVLKDQIELIELKNRAQNAHLPEIQIIDMGKELDKGNNTIISEKLYENIKLSLQKKEQVIIFLNKRGYSAFISCKKCGYVIKCDRCDVSLTYHLKNNILKCHYCGSSKKLITSCPECGSDKIDLFGAGTQQIEKLITHLFPNAAVARMDMDSMTKKQSYEEIYDDFKNRKIDILIGTQMLAKGFDFPEVTTVGVISADAILNLPFYNASEKTFQLLTQVSGRAGRAEKKGKVFIQTYEPENFIINAAKNNDYNLFLNEELKLRKEFAFPPFINIINICLISKNEYLVNSIANQKYEELMSKVSDLIESRNLLLYRPIPHTIYKVNNEYRVNLFMKSSNNILSKLKNLIRNVYMENDIENIKISININTDTV